MQWVCKNTPAVFSAKKKAPMYTTADAYRLAALASVDFRTAARALRGEAVKGLAGERLRAAMAHLATQPELEAISSKEPQQA